jgi:non-ribosomal peptide synthetase component F
VQYGDYAVWQREWLGSGVLEGQMEYWREQLGGELGVLELPVDGARGRVGRQLGAMEELEVSAEVSERLKEVSRREGVTMYMLLLAAFQTLLYRYSGQQDVIIGTDIANRNQGATEGMIGFFINQLVMRTDLSGEPSFRELLRRVREVCLGAYAHQDVPFEKLVDELQPKRELGRAPLFQVKLVLQNAPVSRLDLPDLKLSVMKNETRAAKLDLVLLLSEGTDGIGGELEYNTDLFDAATIQQMIGRFEVLLHSIVAQPDARLDELEILTDAEKEQQASKRKEREEANIRKLTKTRRKISINQ